MGSCMSSETRSSPPGSPIGVRKAKGSERSPNFGSRTDMVSCGVFDGHGPNCHIVAECVRDSLPSKLSANWEANIKHTTGSMKTEDTSFSADEEARAFIDLEETAKHPEIYQPLKESLLKAFKVMDLELRMYTNIECFCSGTTRRQ